MSCCIGSGWTWSSCLGKSELLAVWAETLSALPNFERKPSPLKKNTVCAQLLLQVPPGAVGSSGPWPRAPSPPCSFCCQHQHLCSCKVKWIRERIQLNTNPGKQGGSEKKLIFSWICCPGWLCLQPGGTRARTRRGCGGRKEQRGQQQGWVYGSAGYTA